MNRFAKKALISLTACAALIAVVGVARASYYQYGQQYYGSWTYDGGHNCYYRNYYYQPYSGYQGYRHHVVYYYYQTYPTYYYYYNPYSNVYWGRAPIKSDKPEYSMLAEKDRKKDLKDIPESAFPKPTTPPFIPESKDEKVRMELPPSQDLPTVKAKSDK